MARCRYDWTEYNDRCFRFHTDPVTWVEAERRCRTEGATLATVNNEYEQQFLATQLAQCEHTHSHAGYILRC